MPIFTQSLRKVDWTNPSEAIKDMANHIRYIQEQLEYTLMNLDSSNITSIDTDDTQLSGSSIEGVAELTQTVNGIASTVSVQGSNLASLQHSVSGLSASVRDLETGEATYLRMDSSGVSVVDGAGRTVTIGKGNLSLTGAIYWNDLGSDAQGQVNAANSTANSANATAGSALSVAQQIANGTYSGGTFINGTSIYSPTIYGNMFNVMPRYSSDTSGSFNIYGYYGSSLFQFLSISYESATPPYIGFSSPSGAQAHFTFSHTHIYGNVCMPESYGYSLPSGGSTGQVFFLLE